MLRLKRKAGPIYILHKYNYERIRLGDALSFVFYFNVKGGKRQFGFIRRDYDTVINTLDKSSEEIFSGFTSTVKNEIRRCEREKVEIGFIDNIEIFRNLYNSFALSKGILALDKALLKGYQNNLVITCTILESKILCAHAYLTDKRAGIARLLYSASSRFEEKSDLNFLSRANKYLHFKDMEYFKATGFKVYDFGGIAVNTKDKQKQGINQFKLSFGGEIVKSYDYVSWLSWLSYVTLDGLRLVKKRIGGI